MHLCSICLTILVPNEVMSKFHHVHLNKKHDCRICLLTLSQAQTLRKSCITCLMIMANGPIIIKPLLSHSKKIECKVCQSVFHMKYLSLCPDDHGHMKDNAYIWNCSLCISKIFPLNNIEEDDICLFELNGIDIDEHTIESHSDRLFNPFQFVTVWMTPVIF